MIERQRKRESASGGPLVMIELPEPPHASGAADEPKAATAPSPPTAVMQAPAPRPEPTSGAAGGLLQQSRMTRHDWTLMRAQQMGHLRGQVLYDTSWMASDEAKRLHRRRWWRSVVICAELVTVLAAAAGCAWFVHLLLTALIA